MYPFLSVHLAGIVRDRAGGCGREVYAGCVVHLADVRDDCVGCGILDEYAVIVVIQVIVYYIITCGVLVDMDAISRVAATIVRVQGIGRGRKSYALYIFVAFVPPQFLTVGLCGYVYPRHFVGIAFVVRYDVVQAESVRVYAVSVPGARVVVDLVEICLCVEQYPVVIVVLAGVEGHGIVRGMGKYDANASVRRIHSVHGDVGAVGKYDLSRCFRYAPSIHIPQITQGLAAHGVRRIDLVCVPILQIVTFYQHPASHHLRGDNSRFRRGFDDHAVFIVRIHLVAVKCRSSRIHQIDSVPFIIFKNVVIHLVGPAAIEVYAVEVVLAAFVILDDVSTALVGVYTVLVVPRTRVVGHRVSGTVSTDVDAAVGVFSAVVVCDAVVLRVLEVYTVPVLAASVLRYSIFVAPVE